MEKFFTIQGEGSHTGKAAYFIRIAGCDVGCVWCDVKESWERHEHQETPISELIEAAKASNCNFVVITGGEPAMYDLTNLVAGLKVEGIYCAIETSGCYPLKGAIDWYCFSPKKFKLPCEEAYNKADELKIIINHPSDFAWAEEHAKKVKEDCSLYLQAEWSKSEKILPQIIDYIKSNPRWRISLQTHKYMQIP
jgi:organic radical activating enzyme